MEWKCRVGTRISEAHYSITEAKGDLNKKILPRMIRLPRQCSRSERTAKNSLPSQRRKMLERLLARIEHLIRNAKNSLNS